MFKSGRNFGPTAGLRDLELRSRPSQPGGHEDGQFLGLDTSAFLGKMLKSPVATSQLESRRSLENTEMPVEMTAIKVRTCASAMEHVVNM